MESYASGELVNYVAGNAFDMAVEGTSIVWASTMVSAYQNVADFVEAITSVPNYNKEIIDYCACQTGYNVLFELSDGIVHNLNDVHEMLP